MAEHESWRHFYLQDGEDWLMEPGIEKYTQRIKSEITCINKSVLQQSFAGLANDHNFRSEYSRINYYEIRFDLETWCNERLSMIQAPPYGRDYLLERIGDISNIGGEIEKSSYGHLQEVIRSWREKGTWMTPIIVVQSEEFPEHKFALPYQLFEGHNRLAWMKYFICNRSDLRLAEEHLVWVLHKNG